MALMGTRADIGPIAVIGLGLMGSRMSKRLLDHGFRLRGYDPEPARLEEFGKAGGVPADTAASAVEGCWAALLSLPDSDVSREVCLGRDGIAASSVSGLTVYDTTTGRPADAVEIAHALAKRGVVFCDSTVSGNSALARSGDLVVMMGGPEDAYERGRPIFEAIGRSHHHVGPVGSGSRTKLIVNHLLTIHRMALAEVLVAAEMAGMDLDSTLHVLKDGLAYSRAMDAWGDSMISSDHLSLSSRLRQSRKDARLILEHGLELGTPMNLMAVVMEALAEGEASGLGDLDNSSIIEVVRRRAGIGRLSPFL